MYPLRHHARLAQRARTRAAAFWPLSNTQANKIGALFVVAIRASDLQSWCAPGTCGDLWCG
jgi:hypothetical protein